MLVVLILFLVGFLVLRWKVKDYYGYWKKKGFPYLEASFPFGNVRSLVAGKQFLGEVFQDIYNSFPGEKYVGIFHLNQPVLVLRSPELVKAVLTKDFDSFNGRDELLDPDLEFTARTMFHMQDRDEWKMLRSSLARGLTGAKMRNMTEEMVRSCHKLVSRIPLEGGSLEVKDIASDYTTQVSFSCFFGLDVVTGKGSEIREVADAVEMPCLTTQVRLILFNLCSKLPLLLRVRLMPKLVTNFFLRLASETVTLRHQQGFTRKDMFDDIFHYCKSHSTLLPTGLPHLSCSNVDLEMMAAQCFLFYAASSESSSFTIAATLLALAEHPREQQKLLEEIDTVLAAHGGQITYEGINEMPYLDQVISETLRLMPAVPELTRKCTRDYRTQDGLLVEKGVRVVVPTFALHYDPNHFPQPHLFNPDRFLDPSVKHNYTYLPFGEGPRSCLGKRFGLLQSKIGVVGLLSKYRVEVDPRSDFPIPYSSNMFVVSVNKQGFWVKFVPRSQQPPMTTPATLQ